MAALDQQNEIAYRSWRRGYRMMIGMQLPTRESAGLSHTGYIVESESNSIERQQSLAASASVAVSALVKPGDIVVANHSSGERDMAIECERVRVAAGHPDVHAVDAHASLLFCLRDRGCHCALCKTEI